MAHDDHLTGDQLAELGLDRPGLVKTFAPYVGDDPELTALSFEDWLAYGVEHGFCSPQVCATHAGWPSVDDEDMSEDNDFCVHVVRLGTEKDWQADIDGFYEARMDG